MEVEFILNDTKLKVNENGELWKWTTKHSNCILKEPKWIQLKGSIQLCNKGEYKCHRTGINGTYYITSRVIYYAFYPNLFDINDITDNNTIDHINRNSLDNRLCNLRVANRIEQNLNKKYTKGKGYSFEKNKWRARVYKNKKLIHLGSFDTEEEAFNAYQNAKAEQ